jgi:hypothetical protein
MDVFAEVFDKFDFDWLWPARSMDDIPRLDIHIGICHLRVWVRNILNLYYIRNRFGASEYNH